MSQHDFNIANQSFPATRTDLNNALLALASNSSGDAEPGTTYANQWWYETDTNKLKIRNEADNAWIEIATLDQSSNNVLSITTQGLTLGATALTATGTELNQLDAITRGSILYGNASGATARLAAGSASTVLTSDGTDISWAAAGGGAGGTEFIASSGAISNATSVAFTAFDSSKYDHYVFWFQNFQCNNNGGEIRVQTSTDGGSNYATSNGDYHSGGNTDRQGFMLIGGFGVSIIAGNPGFNGRFELYNPHAATVTYGASYGVVPSTAAADYAVNVHANTHSVGVRVANEDVDAVRFIPESGNITSGEVVMYGIKNS